MYGAGRHRLNFLCQKHLNTDVAWCEAEPIPIATPAGRGTHQLAAKLPVSDNLRTFHQMGFDLGIPSSTGRDKLRTAPGRALLAAYRFESHQTELSGSMLSGVYRGRRTTWSPPSAAISAPRRSVACENSARRGR
ncbi:hypothetical protein [Chachezhania sediminis]|uniref:hypothetical protein n=1 Tax=Chachezhania sediminis TaxID=2599291 RepID=UPI00131BE7C6|nr:hypothetical protein [Chachezhania sediminis]